MTAVTESAFETLTVHPMSGYIGAEVSGVDLTGELDDATIAAIRSVLLRYKVIFFRNQPLDPAQHVALGRRFGEPTLAHPRATGAPGGFREILSIEPNAYVRKYGSRSKSGATSYLAEWHTDVTAAVNPPAISVLRAVVIPKYGGDTIWTNLVAAYEELSAPLRKFLDGLRAEHRFAAGQDAGDEADEMSRNMTTKEMISIHPVVRVHPETGERVLFVNPGFTKRIVDLTSVESHSLLELLYEHLTRPKFTVRFRWDAHSLAIWDNRATAHLAAQDLGPLNVERVVQRVTVVGDRPVGPDGFVSEIVSGAEFGALSRTD
jgi:alpha-ketoglutarate-dependent taurine dioxygenase